MPLETAQYIHQLNPANPSGADPLKQGDDHIRLLKAAIQATFPNLTGPMTLTQSTLNAIASQFVPAGTICLFAGTTAPSGWGICNGSTYQRASGTGEIVSPDLRGRVPVGASPDRALLSTWGQSTRTVTTEVGGAHSHTASTGSAGSHTHAVTASAASSPSGASVSTTTRSVDAGGSASGIVTGVSLSDPGHTHAITGSTEASGAHTHPVTVDGAAGHTHTATVDVNQPSIALNYIIKL